MATCIHGSNDNNPRYYNPYQNVQNQVGLDPLLLVRMRELFCYAREHKDENGNVLVPYEMIHSCEIMLV